MIHVYGYNFYLVNYDHNHLPSALRGGETEVLSGEKVGVFCEVAVFGSSMANSSVEVQNQIASYARYCIDTIGPQMHEDGEIFRVLPNPWIEGGAGFVVENEPWFDYDWGI